MGAVLLGLLSLVVGERWVAPEQPRTWAAMIFLVVGGSVVLYWLIVYVLTRWSASAASYAFLLLPPVAVIYGSLFADEQVTLSFLIGAAVIIAGVWIGGIGSPATDR